MRTDDDPIEGISERVLAAAAAGDRDALTTIWRAANGSVLRYLRVRGVAEVGRVARLVWEEVARRIARLGTSPAEFTAALFTVAHEVSEGERADRPMAGESDAASGPHADALAAIGTLPPAAAEVVYLRLVVELADVDVARIVGIEPADVDAVLTRALATLVDHADDGFEAVR